MHPAAAVWRQEPDTNDRNRVENARPSGIFCDALRSFAGMLSSLEYPALPASLHSVISDVDGRGTNLSVFLFIVIADLLVLRGDLLDWQLPWSPQNTMPVCPATPWGPSPANSVAANRPKGLTWGTGDVMCCIKPLFGENLQCFSSNIPLPSCKDQWICDLFCLL